MHSNRLSYCATIGFITWACGGSETPAQTSAGGGSPPQGMGGTGTSTSGGGTAGTGGTAAGGNPASGGTQAQGGTSASGGTQAQGGTSASGGTQAQGGTSASGGVANTMPEQCRLPVESTPNVILPQTITFKLVNGAGSPRYLSPAFPCGSGMQIRSCADGYTTVQPSSASCMANCASAVPGCIACGACLPDAKEILPGAAFESTWTGNFYNIVQRPSCSCYNALPAPSGKYRASIAVYESALAAETFDSTGELIVVDFAYPDDDGYVTVEIGLK